MVASGYSSSTGAEVMPSFTNRAGSTPDSRSRINQPSARTVSLTQNGIRQTANSSALARPRATLVMTQAAGNAISSVSAVASAENIAVRTNTCQYSGSVKKVLNCSRLGSENCGAEGVRGAQVGRAMC